MGRFGRYIGLLGLLGLGLVGSAQGQRVRMGVAKDSLLIGDSVHVNLWVSASPKADIYYPQIPDTMGGGLELLAPPVFDTLENNDSVFSARLWFPVSAYDSGLYVIPGIPFLIQNAGVSDTVFSEPRTLYVSCMAPDTAVADILPIRGPMHQRITLAEVLPWVLGCLLLVILGVLVYYLLLRRRRTEEGESLRAAIPADEYALGILREQLDRKAWRNPGAKAYFTEVTGALRYFLSEVWGVRALEETTSSILEQLRDEHRCDAARRATIERVLKLADQVKFARYEPLEHECTEAGVSVIDFVEAVAAEERAEKERKEKARAAEEALLAAEKSAEENGTEGEEA